MTSSASSKQIIQANNLSSNQSYLQLSKKNTKQNLSHSGKMPNNLLNNQNQAQNIQQVTRSHHREGANHNNIKSQLETNNKLKNNTNVNNFTEVKIRQHSNPQFQQNANFQTVTPIMNSQMINRVRSLSPTPVTTNQLIQVIPNLQFQQGNQQIRNLNAQYSSYRAIQSQQLQIAQSQNQLKQAYTPIRLLSPQQDSIILKKPNQPISSNKLYEEYPLQSSLMKDFEITSPKNTFAIAVNQSNQQLKSDRLIQSCETPNILESGINSQQQSIIEKYFKRTDDGFVFPSQFNQASDNNSQQQKKYALGVISGSNSQINLQNISSVPISDRQTADTFNQYDEIFAQESQYFTKKIDEIFSGAEIQKQNDLKESEFTHSHNKQNQISINPEQIQYTVTASLQDKVKIETLEKQIQEKDNQIMMKNQQITQLEEEVQKQQLKFQDLSNQILNLLKENNEFKEQITQGNQIPSHIIAEIQNLKNNIKLYEQQVQVVVQSEQALKQQLENEIQNKNNLNCMIEELEYQLAQKKDQYSSSSSPCNSEASKEDIIIGLSYEKNSLQDQNKKLKRKLKEMKENQLRITLEYEKEILKLQEEKEKAENQLKHIDNNHKRKHSFVQAENSYVLGQLIVMKNDIEEKQTEIEKLKAQIQQLEQKSTSKNNSSVFDNEIQQISNSYQALLENEQLKYRDTCQTYELEISHYKQQIQSLIENGNGAVDERIVQLKSEIMQLQQANQHQLIQIVILNSKNEQIQKELEETKQKNDFIHKQL
ncbi:hypothetical protein ABPG72_011592 [Tetrahymena utriculariae]